MQLIEADKLRQILQGFEGKDVYVHVEVNPGALLRNVRVKVRQAHLAGTGAYRIALRIEEEGWIRVEGITHFHIDHRGRLLTAGYDDRNRIAAVLQVGLYPFDFDGEAV
ncbi:DUF1806 family protein [Paenibacillus sp. SI8]|uniref:DUF1806 family protein n=1 Tax=unclassified Paenibacillus TaxID=185978 RepID=UPI0034672BE1